MVLHQNTCGLRSGPWRFAGSIIVGHKFVSPTSSSSTLDPFSRIAPSCSLHVNRHLLQWISLPRLMSMGQFSVTKKVSFCCSESIQMHTFSRTSVIPLAVPIRCGGHFSMYACSSRVSCALDKICTDAPLSKISRLQAPRLCFKVANSFRYTFGDLPILAVRETFPLIVEQAKIAPNKNWSTGTDIAFPAN